MRFFEKNKSVGNGTYGGYTQYTDKRAHKDLAIWNDVIVPTAPAAIATCCWKIIDDTHNRFAAAEGLEENLLQAWENVVAIGFGLTAAGFLAHSFICASGGRLYKTGTITAIAFATVSWYDDRVEKYGYTQTQISETHYAQTASAADTYYKKILTLEGLNGEDINEKQYYIAPS